jgi:2-aminoadipate transaminase
MAVTPETGRWDELFAARTRADVGEGIAFVLSFLGKPDLISFAGGLPDPRTFPRERAAALLEEFAASGESAAFQYTPTQGLAGTLDAVAGRLESLQGRRPADDELLITSGGIEALELVGKTFLDRGDTVVVEGPTYLGAIMAVRGF